MEFCYGLYSILQLLILQIFLAEGIEVNIKGIGIIEGMTKNLTNKQVDTFWRIPFAEPPTGSLRFMPPKPAAPWTGTRNSSATPVICPQQNGVTKMLDGMEDCLYLIVFRPRIAVGKKLPVMVFIHGGGYSTGSGYYYNGQMLAVTNDVVVVTINYRLGILGFFNAPGTNITGNYGLMDQILALKWVKAHIADFGGDENKVTIFGESAGAGSVTLLMLSPLAKGLFTRVIAESGAPSGFWAIYKATDPKDSAAFAASLNCSSLAVECLRGKTSLDILKQRIKLPPAQLTLVSPTVDGHVMPVYPFDSMAQGKLPISAIDLMIGFNKDEGTMFMRAGTKWDKGTYEAELKTWLMPQYSANIDAVREMVAFEYLTKPELGNNSYALAYNDFLAEYMFKMPVVNMATQWSTKNKNTFLYKFTFLPKHVKFPNWGVAHSIELDFVFGLPLFPVGDPAKKLSFLISNFTKDDGIVSENMMRMWANFAKTGNPGNNWPQFNANSKEYLEINFNTTTKTNYNPRRMTFWNDMIPKMIKMTSSNKCTTPKPAPTNAPVVCSTPKSTADAANLRPLVPRVFWLILAVYWLVQ